MNRFASGKSVYLGFILVLIICAIACVPAQNASPPAPSSPVVALPAPAATDQDSSKLPTLQQTQKIIFQDDFKDAKSGWTVFTNDFGEGKYETGSYFLKCTQPSYLGAKTSVTTANASLMALTSFMIDMDVTMLSGSRLDCFGIVLKWPDINNPGDFYGYDQPSDYYFLVVPEEGAVSCYTQQEIKNSSVDKSPGFFYGHTHLTCVRGVNSVNNIKIRFNPGIRFMVNDYELVNTTDLNLDYVNRLIKDKAIPGAMLQIAANSQDTYSRPVFQLNKIIVYENN